MSESSERLHKRIAASGLCSRRAAETLIAEGRVTVNGYPVSEMGIKVEPDDVVAVDGQQLEASRHYYLILNKPKGYITTMSDPHGRRTVVQLIPKLSVPLKPVGRLDKDTEGLLIFTNDGNLAQRLMHPRYQIDKEYAVIVRGLVDSKSFDKLSKGIWIPEGGKTSPAKVDKVYVDEKKDRTSFRITIHEGRKRQIRQMCLAIGHPVKELKRTRIGPISMTMLPKGDCRMLGKEEVADLMAAVGIDAPVETPKHVRYSRSKKAES